MKKVLITGAAGKTGLAVIKNLSKKNFEISAVVHHEEQVKLVQQAGAQHVFTADLLDEKQLKNAISGNDAIYHICPNMAPDEVEIGARLIRLCQQADVRQFIYHSVLHPQISRMPHHWKKMLVEEKLFESGLNFTILQPAVYMQNILGYSASIQQGIYPMPYPVESRLSMLDLSDLADVVGKVLQSNEFDHATLELVGTLPISQEEIAETLTRITGRNVRAVEVSLTEWNEQAKAGNMPDYPRKTLISMFEYYRDFGLPGNPTVLSWLLGRSPSRLDDCLSREFNLKSGD